MKTIQLTKKNKTYTQRVDELITLAVFEGILDESKVLTWEQADRQAWYDTQVRG